ncbi:hypothetical protein OAK19_00490 [Aureispira]|nr:hypothetical protein [Aureispira sp.]
MKLNVFTTILLTTLLSISLLGQHHHKGQNFKSVINFDSKYYFGQNHSGSWGFYLANSTRIIESKYDTLYPLHKVEFNPKNYISKKILCNLIIGKKKKEYTIYNIKGKQIITIDGLMPRLMTNNIILVKKNNKWGLINSKGEFILPIEGINPEWYDDMLCLHVNNKIVLFDALKGVLIEARNLYEIQ